ncbi:TetR/AcrR family transcriptional regulator [Calidifontibacter terrae]
MNCPSASSPSSESRPRVEGEREQQIFEATLDELYESGYDRMTMDNVATRAKASKATLYRRWSNKSALVMDALLASKTRPAADTGTLRGDLLQTFCGLGGLNDDRIRGVFTGILTAIDRDEQLALAYRERFIGPKKVASRAIFERARDRGEVCPGLDLDLIAAALPAIVLHQSVVMGEDPTSELVEQVIDQIILPACNQRRN